MKLGMIFPGYGAQFVSMGKELYDESRIMQEYFEQASHCLDINYIKLCFASSDVELSKMQHAYTSLFLMSSSIYSLLKQMGIEPDVVAGYNTGQYAAMYAAQAFTFPDGLYLLNKLSLFCQELFDAAPFSLMRITGLPIVELQKLCKKIGKELNIAIYETDEQAIVSGSPESIDELIKSIPKEYKIKLEPMPVEVGLHSGLMHPAVEQFRVYLKKVDLKDVEVPVITNTTGQPVTESETLKHEIIQQVCKPVLWQQTIQALADCDLLLIIGPDKQLGAMLEKQYPDKKIIKVIKPEDIEKVKEILGFHNQPERKEQEIGL